MVELSEETTTTLVQEVTTRILLVDDDPIILEALSVYFSTTDDLEVRGAVTTGGDALRWLGDKTCDLVLSDIHMPDIDGTELLQEIRQFNTPPSFIAMTAFDADETMIKCLSFGASGYILKSESPDQIVAAVRTAMAEGTALSPECTSRLIARCVLRQDSGKTPPLLTAEQQQIVTLIRQGKTNREIAQETNYAEITIKKKISRMLVSNGFKSRAELAFKAKECLGDISLD